MAFVNATPLTASLKSAPALRTDLSGAPVRAAAAPARRATTTMGYGDYSYLTDSTKGHVNQYYVDKFRNVYDFAKGQPASEQDAMVGRNMKNGPKVPVEGIKQLDESYTSIVPISDDVVPDPRIEESEGSLYPWDPNYQNPEFAASTFADVNSDIVATDAFAKFRGSLSEERAMAISALDYQANLYNKKVTSMNQSPFDEEYISCLEGQLDVEYVKLQKLGSPATLNPTGIPQTEIPGFPYMPAVGALDFMKKDETELAFWKADTPEITQKAYKTPAGNEMPELPYNKSATIDAVKLVQQARDIIPKEE